MCPMPSGYIISWDHKKRRYIECLSCRLRSYNFNDILNRYCAACHSFHDETKFDDDDEADREQ